MKKKKTFFSRHGMRIMLSVFFLLPFCLLGARRALLSNTKQRRAMAARNLRRNHDIQVVSETLCRRAIHPAQLGWLHARTINGFSCSRTS